MLLQPGLRLWTLALVAVVSGCANWHAYDGARIPGKPLPYQLRATRPDSSRIELTAPFIRSDSLYGRVRGDTVAIPFSDIANLERSRFSVSRTAALVLGVPLVGFTVAYLVLCQIGNCEGQTDILPAGLSQ